MKLPMKIVWALIAVFVCVALTQIYFSGEEQEKEQKEPQEVIVDKAFHTDNLSTFVTALKMAKLNEPLSSKRAVTIFAPSDSAFASLPEGQFSRLMDANNQDELKSILNYHAVEGVIRVSDLEDGQTLKTLQGNTIRVSFNDEGEPVINGVKLVKANIQAANGIIHVIDRVMMPGSNGLTMKK